MLTGGEAGRIQGAVKVMGRYGQALLRRRWPLGVLACALGAWAIHAAFDGSAPDNMQAARPVGPSEYTAATQAAPAPRARPPALAAARLVRPAAPATHAGANQAEICGFGNVEIAAHDPDSLQGIPATVRNAALDAVDAQMLASADEQIRAAALLIGGRTRSDSRARIDQLVRLAVVSTDAVVYAMALEACKGVDAGGCTLLSRAQWVRLDPDNAQTWLALAAEARQQQDAAAEADAMRRAASARHSDAHAGLLPNLVEKALGEHAPPLQRTLALSMSWGVQAAWVASHSAQAYEYCAADAVAQPGRRETCEALADTLSHHGTSLADLGIGLAIGRHLGWPAQRLQALQREQDALTEASGFHAIGVDFGCEAVDRMQGWMRQLGTGGELQALREVLARSGRSVEDWGAQHRRNFALATATAEAAAIADPPVEAVR